MEKASYWLYVVIYDRVSCEIFCKAFGSHMEIQYCIAKPVKYHLVIPYGSMINVQYIVKTSVVSMSIHR